MCSLSNIVRSKGDPTILSTGPSSLAMADRAAKALGWFSIGLGVAELMAPRSFTRAFGMEGGETLVRLYGVREIGAGVLSLSVDRQLGLWSRVVGDALDVATLVSAAHPENRQRGNVGVALAMVLGVTLLDVVCSIATTASHTRIGTKPRDYSNRSGFPQGLARARGAARSTQATKTSSENEQVPAA